MYFFTIISGLLSGKAHQARRGLAAVRMVFLAPVD
jgi:hypothetical protein